MSNEPLIRGTLGQYKDFLEGVVWQDLVRQLAFMREGVRDSLEDCKDVEEIFRFQGRAEALRDIVQLPIQIFEGLQEDKIGDQKLKEDLDG